MDLYNVATRLSRLITDGSYTTLNQLFIYINTNKTLQQFTHNFPLETVLKLTFYIDAVKKNLEKKEVDWSINNNLYTFDVICFGDAPGDIDCDECRGSGHDICGDCGGDGEYSCHNCDGTGEVDIEDDEGNSDKEECDYCDGKGYVGCDNCGGSGDEDCRNCDGDGYVTDYYKVPQITVITYISYDLNLETEIEDFFSEMKEVVETSFATNHPVLFALDKIYNSENIKVSSIPKKNWDKCFINSVGDYDNNNFTNVGHYKQSIVQKNLPDLYDINEKLLDE